MVSKDKIEYGLMWYKITSWQRRFFQSPRWIMEADIRNWTFGFDIGYGSVGLYLGPVLINFFYIKRG